MAEIKAASLTPKEPEAETAETEELADVMEAENAEKAKVMAEIKDAPLTP
eukprot:CAMPEP_0172593934 /NCGR_PEP_ID=MMETSP1068-20121228/13198_1 /TAXON_ID=35684 /ORGANISM="Pseudopedinella elastica, Strain CCMP716" /LENGTH=49 /DNA_ID= /DNA_START= /DNA_END= /DNA_ORIENTATION=